MRSNLFPVAKEGLKYLSSLTAFLLVTLIFDFDFLSFIAAILIVAVAYVFRNPERALLSFESASVISPVDGLVKSIDELSDSKYAYRIEIQSDYKHTSLLRAPFYASVKAVQKYNGTRVSSNSKLFNDTNEKIELLFLDSSENSVKVVHQLTQSFAPLFIELLPAQKLIQTARYGVMINGVTTVYLPHNFRLNINIGNELKAGESLIGYFS